MAWLKQYQFYVFVFWLVKFTVSRQYDIIVERVQCIRSPNDLCYNMSCGVRLISRNLTYIDAECSLREPIDNLMVRMILFYKFAEYRKFLVDIEVDVCDYLKNTTSTLLAKAVLTSVIGQLTNITSCPIKDMSEYKCENEKPPIYTPHKPVTGVIGASFSVVSIMVANILRLFKIPQISYASTSTELSDKSRFEYFSRVVPPDNFQAQAMVEIVKALDWRYASTVAVEGEYGEKGIASFISIAASVGICVAVSEKILRNSKTEDFDRIIEHLMQKPQARAVIIFVDEDNVKKLLQASIRANRTGHFFWIGSDSWGAKMYPVRDQEFAAVNTITVLPHRTSLEGFDKYFRSLRPKRSKAECADGTNIKIKSDDGQRNFLVNCRNIWFKEFWEQHHKCSFDGKAAHRCSGKEVFESYEQEGLVPFVVDAVYAMAHAVDRIIKDKCGNLTFDSCDAIQPAPLGPELLKYIHNVSFLGLQNTEIKFNKDGDAYGYYNIYQYQHNDKKFDYVPVGSWKKQLNLTLTKMKWEGGEPKSICSEACPIGHIRNHQDQCCWTCVNCREDQYVNNDTCVSCDPGWEPNEMRLGCNKLIPEIIDWLSPWALVPLVLAGFGIFCTIFTTCVFIKYNRTPVIMASGRELCYVLLSGILCCYSMSFVILARPTVNRCAIMRIGLGLCLSICYSAIFTKTNRISRIFNRGVKSVQRPVYTSPLSQIAISFGILSIQLIGTIAWLVIERPDVKEIHPQPLQAVLTCKVSTFSLIMSLVYNMILIILCTLYAFKTRKIPENFNEAKYIGFTMYSTCIVWLVAFLPIYFGTNNDYKIQISSMCMCLSISASVILGCLFTPKVYLVLFQPYKNVRPGNGNQLAGGDPNRPAHSMRFAGTRSQTIQSMTSATKSSPRASSTGNRYLSDDPIHQTTPSIEESSIT